jgi:hypothetical protein
MKFCTWYSLNESASLAPTGPMIWQVRLANGLVSYPRGKSAMVHYQLSSNSAAVDILAFARAHPLQSPSWRCRHLISEDEQALPPDASLDEFFDTLLAQFVARFGQMPQVPPI